MAYKSGDRWTDNEIGIITQGIQNGLPHAAIAQLLPGRSKCSISKKVRGLGLGKTIRWKTPRKWTEQELEIFAEAMRKKLDPAQIDKLLPDIPYKTIYGRITKIRKDCRKNGPAWPAAIPDYGVHTYPIDAGHPIQIARPNRHSLLNEVISVTEIRQPKLIS